MLQSTRSSSVSTSDSFHQRPSGPRVVWPLTMRSAPSRAAVAALRYLNPFAGGILRRKQRERGAAVSRDALDHAVEGMVGIHVGTHVDLLSGMDLLQLRLLEVGVHPELLLRDHDEERHAGLHGV